MPRIYWTKRRYRNSSQNGYEADESVLYGIGRIRIEYLYNIIGKNQMIRLLGDGCDSCDSDIPLGKQPSQPSPTVTLWKQLASQSTRLCAQSLVCYTAISLNGSIGLPVRCRPVELLNALR